VQGDGRTVQVSIAAFGLDLDGQVLDVIDACKVLHAQCEAAERSPRTGFERHLGGSHKASELADAFSALH
jgi:sRNA-binding protein